MIPPAHVGLRGHGGQPTAASSRVAHPAGVRALPTSLVLLAWAAIALGITVRHGTLRVDALLLVLIGAGVLLLAVLGGGRTRWARRLNDRLPGVGRLGLPPALVVPAAVVVASEVYAPVWRYGAGAWLPLAAALPLVAAVVAVTARNAARAALAAGVAVAAGLATLAATTRPSIDVWYMLDGASRDLLRGANAYTQTWPDSPGHNDLFPYLPLTAVLLAPVRAIGLDVRVGLLAASVLAAWFAYRLARPTGPWHLVPLLLLVQPWQTFLWRSAWTEPLLLAALGGMVLAVRRDRTGLAVLAFAVALATKQHVALLLPVAALWPAFGWRRTVTAAGLAAAAVLPWLVADPAAMWHDAVLGNTSLPVWTSSLSLPGAIAAVTGRAPTFGVLILLVAAAYVLAWRCLPRTAAGFCLGSALVILAIDLGNKQSFFNHYSLALGLLVFAVAADLGRGARTAGGP